MTGPPLKPMLVLQSSGTDIDQTAYAQLSLPDGKFIKFSLDRAEAYKLVFELTYHLQRQEKAIADAPKTVPDPHG